MLQKPHSLCLIALLLTALLTAPLATAAKLYRWTDGEGNIHYSDRLPPEESGKARTLLNERGIRVDSVRSALTPEEIAREKELERLRLEQQRLIDEQKAADRVLLRTFRSEDDITMTLSGKLAAIDVQIQVIRSNIKRLKRKVEEMQKDAASMERSGERISKNFLKEIENTRLALKDSYAAIIRNENQKEQYRTAYKQDLDRFRKLKKLSSTQAEETGVVVKNLILDRLFPCSDKATCDQAWAVAEGFVMQFATTKVKMLSETIIMTAAPIKEQDISITVARILNKSDNPEMGAKLFMDLQCKNSPLGVDLCASAQVEKIRVGFKKYMNRQSGQSAAANLQSENKAVSRTAH